MLFFAISLNSGSWTTAEHDINLVNSEKYLSKQKKKHTKIIKLIEKISQNTVESRVHLF